MTYSRYQRPPVEFPGNDELCCKSACFCCSQSFFCKFPRCIGCYQDNTCLCCSSNLSCNLSKPISCCLITSDVDVCSATALSCSGPICLCASRAACCCCIDTSTEQYFDISKCKCIECRETCCCFDSRCAFPTTDDVPCELGCCGIMCIKKISKSANTITVVQQQQVAPKQEVMSRGKPAAQRPPAGQQLLPAVH